MRSGQSVLALAARRLGETLFLAGCGLAVLLAVTTAWRKWTNLDVPGGVWGALVIAYVLFALGVLLPLLVARHFGKVRWRAIAVLPPVLAALVVLGLPALVVHVRGSSHDELGKRAITKLDLVLVVPAGLPKATELAFPPTHPEWNVNYSAFVVRRGVPRLLFCGVDDPAEAFRLLRELAPNPGCTAVTLRDGAVKAIVLDADAIPIHTDDPARLAPASPTARTPGYWKKVTTALPLSEPVPVFAVLRESREERRADWRAWTRSTGGDAMRIRVLRTQTLIAAAERLVTERGTAFADRVLAFRFRPFLRFDSREEYPVPMNVEARLFGGGRVQLCSHNVSGAGCNLVSSASQLDADGDYLDVQVLNPREVRRFHDPSGLKAVPAEGLETNDKLAPAVGENSVIYYRVVRPAQSPRVAKNSVVIDYWWYFPYNDSPVVPNVLCAPGLGIGALTCFEHQSDWEGITVILKRDEGTWALDSVNYAQHDSVVRYRWTDLQAYWANKDAPQVETHPLVYVARGSHASYPVACLRSCTRDLPPRLADGKHDGSRDWPNNDAATCASLCLRQIPTTRNGVDPALWSGFPGRWGTNHCILWETYCDISGPPKSPGLQERYIELGAADGDGRLPGAPRSSSKEEGMALWVILIIVLCAGAAGGLINALLSDNHGFVMPKLEEGILRPGFLTNVLVGAAASFVSWSLYGQYAGFPLVGGTLASDTGYSETLSAIGGAFLVGIAGARYLTSEVDKKLLKRTAAIAAAGDSNPDAAAAIATATPAAALRMMSAAEPSTTVITEDVS